MSRSPISTTRPYDAGSVRDRLLVPFADLWARRLGMVVASAGSGKTTLLSQVAEASGAPVVWYRAEDVYTHPSDLLSQLGEAFAEQGYEGDWRSLHQAVAALDAATPAPVLLVVDDLHRLEGTEAEAVLERFVDLSPPALAVVAASRATPAWNLSRRRVAGRLVEVSGEDLRFRSWEVEQLFLRHYGMPLGPTDLAALTRRTEGWAAALQLFHLAAAGKSPAECRRMVAALGSDLRIVREYLVRNVLDELPPDARRFLLDTCVLGRLRQDLCDELRDRPGSEVHLGELERRQLVGDCGEGWFRAHEVLRAHLETTFLQVVGEREGRARYLWAGSLLESAGALPDALRAYCRAEDWDAAARLLGRKGEQLSEDPADWLDGLSPALLDQDPWLLLAEARRKRAGGRWTEALLTYQRAERAMAAAEAAALCRRERAALAAWLDPHAVRLDDWSGRLRLAMTSNPMSVHRRCAASPDARDLLVAGLAALAAGSPRAAGEALARVAEHPDAGPVLVAAARLGAAGVALLSGQAAPPLDRVTEQLESLGIGGLTRVARVLGACSGDGDVGQEIAAAITACSTGGDPWGEALARLLLGWSLLGRDRPDEAARSFREARAAFARLGAEVPEVFARSLHALAEARRARPDAGSAAAASGAEAASRAAGSPGAQAIAMMALAESEPAAPTGYEGLLARTGLVLPPARGIEEQPTAAARPPTMRCFRGFALSIGGRGIDLGRCKPKARKVLRILATQYPEWTHREVLMEAVWPGADPAVGARNLQVAISSLRHVLEPEAPRGRSMIARQGLAYRLALPPGAQVDHVAVDDAVAAARAAQLAGDTEAFARALARVLDLADGPFLPEDGPDDWVLPKRARYRACVTSAALSLAELHAAGGRPAEAAEACRRGLAADACADGLWRVLIDTTEAAGDLAAAARARREYASVLAELGLPGPMPEDERQVRSRS